jgi:hypothetical protein
MRTRRTRQTCQLQRRPTHSRDLLALVQLEWVDNWEAFRAVLEVRFRDGGQRKVEDGEFVPHVSRTGVTSKPVAR